MARTTYLSDFCEWAESGGSLTGSPFVRAFAAVGIPYAAGAMNVVVISAAISSANSNLYSTTRMLLSLARSLRPSRMSSPVMRSFASARGIPCSPA